VRAEDGELPEPSGTIIVRQRRSIGIALIVRSVFTLYPRRTLLCFVLFIGQAFLYNAFFFTYGDTLTTFLGVKQTGLAGPKLPASAWIRQQLHLRQTAQVFGQSQRRERGPHGRPVRL
jgi:hypothetical protein